MYTFSRCAILFALWLLFGAVLMGCKTAGGGPDRLYTVTEEVAEARLRLPDYERAYNDARSEAERRRLRNEYITRRMYIIDVEYTEYETALTRERQQFGFASALTTQALSTAGAAFTAASTVRVLSALASGVNASRGFYDSELLLSKTIQIAQGHMRAQRDRVARAILLQRGKSTYEYPLSLALHDLEDYYRAGTVTSGLIEAVSAAGDQAQVAATEKAAAQGIPDADSPLPPALKRWRSFADAPRADEVRAFQAALCIPVDGKVGPQLRAAAADFISGRRGAPPQEIKEISKMVESELNDAQSSVPNCFAAGFRSPYEVGAFGVSNEAKDAAARIKELQAKLGVPETGAFDPQTRAGIRKFRDAHKDDNLAKPARPELIDQVDRNLMRLIFK